MMACIMPASGQVSAQIGPIKKEGGVYYEYIEPVASIYKQYINSPNANGLTVYQFKTLAAANTNTIKANDYAISQMRMKFAPEATCVFGPPVLSDPAINYGTNSATKRFNSNIPIIVKRDYHSPCEPSNYVGMGSPPDFRTF